jgi:Tfp pilus assembly protein PilZ
VGDYCRLHRAYLETGIEHAGIIVVPRQRYSIKQQIRLLLDLIKTRSAEDMWNRLLFM